MVDFTVYKGSKSGAIVKATTTREVKPGEVLVRITHSGLCGTDEHYKCADMVLGHEGVGIVEELGSDVTILAKGDSVGWGYQHASCLNCKWCLTGRETLCAERKMYGGANVDQGSFGTYAVWRADFLFKIPDSIPRELAAPLMCGGATVYATMVNNGVKAGDRVGILGIGGLGHLAIQYASKMGCEVIVFSGTDSKKEEATRLGASEFYATKEKGWEKNFGAQIDHLIVTASFSPNWDEYAPLLAPRATIHPLTVDLSGKFSIPHMLVITSELTVQGSLVAARQIMRDMLTFSAHHKITPMIEKFPMSEEGITKAMTKLADGGMRYRGVIVVE